MVTVREDKNDITFASDFYFPDHNGTMRESIDQCTPEEMRALCKMLFRKIENSYKYADDVATNLGQMIGWVE
jgi:hypothetical protein